MAIPEQTPTIIKETQMLRSCRFFFISLMLWAVPFSLFSSSACASENQDDQWQYQLAGYSWLAGQKGSLSTFPNMPEVDVDIDFWDDILGNINGALYLIGEARRGSFGAFMDVAYSDVEIEENTPGQYFSSITSRTKTWMVTTAGFYRLMDNSQGFLDLLAGIRYWSLESTLGLTSGILEGGDVTNSKSWIDPVIGAKGLMPVGSSRFFMSGAMVFGGFGAGADFMWDGSLNLGYNWTESIATTVGYRYLIVEYDKDGFVYDVDQQGPTLAFSWRF